MFGESFKEFDHDPFFDFGASQFGQQHHQLHFNDTGRARSVPRHHGDGEAGRQHHHHQQLHHRPSDRALVPRQRGGDSHSGPPALPGYSFGRPQFDRLFEGVSRMMADVGGRMLDAQEAAKREDFDGSAYCHSAVYGYSSGGGGSEPRVYQAVSESRAGPGGVRETRRALKDSRTREEKVAVGRHIGGRGHTVERRRNTRTGDQQEDHHFDGIDENDGDHFDREWDNRAARVRIADGGGGGGGWERQRHRRRLDDRGGGWGGRRAITDGSHQS